MKPLKVALFVVFIAFAAKAYACGGNDVSTELIVENARPNLHHLETLCQTVSCKKDAGWVILRSAADDLIFINSKDIVFVTVGFRVSVTWREYFSALSTLNDKGVIDFPKTLFDSLSEKILAEEERQRQLTTQPRCPANGACYSYPFYGLPFLQIKDGNVFFKPQNISSHPEEPDFESFLQIKNGNVYFKLQDVPSQPEEPDFESIIRRLGLVDVPERWPKGTSLFMKVWGQGRLKGCGSSLATSQLPNAL